MTDGISAAFRDSRELTQKDFLEAKLFVNAKDRLVVLASEMARCNNMLSSNTDDWINMEKYKLIEQAEVAERQCKEWAVELRKIHSEI